MKETRGLTNPLARKEGLVIQELPDEVLVYDLEADRAHCLNDTAAFVWRHCDGRKSTSDIARLLTKKVKANVDERIIWLALDKLSENKLLQRRPAAPPFLTGMNRRQMIHAIGVAAVVAVPAVTSIIAPTPAQAATCIASGQACTTSPQCCSGLCNANVCA